MGDGVWLGVAKVREGLRSEVRVGCGNVAST